MIKIKLRVKIMLLITILLLSSCSATQKSVNGNDMNPNVNEKNVIKRINLSNKERLLVSSLGFSEKSIIAYDHTNITESVDHFNVNIEFFKKGKSLGNTLMEVSLNDQNYLIGYSKLTSDIFEMRMNSVSLSTEMESLDDKYSIQTYAVNTNNLNIEINKEFVLAVKVINMADSSGLGNIPDIPTSIFTDDEFDFSEILKNDMVCIIKGSFVQ